MTGPLPLDPMFPAAQPLVRWPDRGDTDENWLAARRQGLGASEVASALGLPGVFSTPWQVWAEKTGRSVSTFEGNDAAQLGTDLEPWLINAAVGRLQARAVSLTGYRLYGSLERPWLLASPDAYARWGLDENRAPYYPMALVECKTAGLLEPNAVKDWTDTDVPLRVEVQCRAQMAVMGIRTRVYVVGLVVGFGLRSWVVEWDQRQEDILLKAAGEWWQTHVVEEVEPAMFPADDAVMNGIYPAVEGAVELPPVADLVLEEYRAAVAEGAAAERRRRELAATLKRWLAGSTVGELGGRSVVTWYENVNGVRSLKVKGV